MLIFDSQCRQIDSLPPDRKCVILNSRQSKRPCNRDDWVTATARAVDGVIRRGLTVITSIGLNTWELTTHLVNIRRGRQIIVLPSMGEESIPLVITQTISDFKLDPARCLFVAPTSDTIPGKSAKDFWPERDFLAVELADVVLPLSIRPGGNFDRLQNQAATAGKEICNDFRVDYRRPADRVRYDFEGCTFNPALDDPNWRYVIHWTRSSHGPYPAETRFEYYRDILASDTYCRSAYHTLVRIASDRTIRSTNRFISGGYQVVSFSALEPREAIKLMRWRRRYVCYSFEPYGIAIQTDTAIAAGLRPVVYGDDDLYSQLADCDRPFFQSRGSEVSDWRPEAEWRCLGDLNLQRLPADGIKLITYTYHEAAALQQLTKYEVIPLILA
ncbi:MAG: hypothetical protein NT028_12240 [candidate division Zixibacteria bacterium]|nr:hypothetical protein [candidate division Zixibacteria bacterium]